MEQALLARNSLTLGLSACALGVVATVWLLNKTPRVGLPLFLIGVSVVQALTLVLAWFQIPLH